MSRNVLQPGQAQDGYDACYAPHQSWITGCLDVHDIGFGPDARPVFVNTLFNCIATVSDGYSFRPVWRPSFISRLAAEDRGVAAAAFAPAMRYCPARGPAPQSTISRTNFGEVGSEGRVERTSRAT